MKSIVTFLLGFIVGAIGMYFFTAQARDAIFERNVDDANTPTLEENADSIGARGNEDAKLVNADVPNVGGEIVADGPAEVVVNAQTAGTSVIAARVVLPENGWIVIHEVIEGRVGNALGAARRDAGLHTDVTVELLRPTVPSSEYVAVLYADNGNKQFDVNADLPIVDSNGEGLLQTFRTTDAVVE